MGTNFSQLDVSGLGSPLDGLEVVYENSIYLPAVLEKSY
jgi:hypothetical protein